MKDFIKVQEEKLYNASKFVIDLMVDNLVPFNAYIKQQLYQLMQYLYLFHKILLLK